MFTFQATATGANCAYDKSATMADEAAVAMISSMKNRFRDKRPAQTYVGGEPVLDAQGNPTFAPATEPQRDENGVAMKDENGDFILIPGAALVHAAGDLVFDSNGQPVLRDLTNEEAINFALGAFFAGWAQNAREDAIEAAAAAMKAQIPPAPDWTVL